MKVRNFINFLMDFNMDAEIVVSNGGTFNDYEEMDISWGGPNCGDGSGKKDAEFIYVNNLADNRLEK
jgi:hypothetical protein